MKFIFAPRSNKKNIATKNAPPLNRRPYRVSFSGDSPPDDNAALITNAPDIEETLSETTCAFCKTNFGVTKLQKLSVYPICDACKTELDQKIFPSWVKLFFAGVLVLVFFSIFWNWRFYSAYFNIKKSFSAIAKNDVPQASFFMGKAASDVPEAKEIGEMDAYYKALGFIAKDKTTLALTELEKCKDLPTDFHINELTLQAEMGSAFDKQDYQLFLTTAKAFLQLDTTKSQSWASVSSAYACLYAQNNTDTLRQQALTYISKAKAIDDTSADAKDYYGIIQYRIDSRQIITREQYKQKFPNGYTSK